jgi:replicative DNA helicase
MLNNNKYYYSYKKFPIRNLLAEEIIIGFLLSYISIKNKIKDSINLYFFTLRRYRLLFQYIIDQDKPINPTKYHLVKLVNNLWTKRFIQEIGGIDEMIQCIQKFQIINSLGYKNEYIYLKYFINTLQYYYLKRIFIQYSNYLIELNYFYNNTIKDIYIEAFSSLHIIKNIYQISTTQELKAYIQKYIYTTKKLRYEQHQMFSGFEDLDKIINGFNQGDLVIIAGRPSMGKTSFALNLLRYLACDLSISVYMFSLEMSKNEILDKLIALISNTSIQIIQQKILTKKQWSKIQQACNKLSRSPIHINDNSNSSIDDIKNQCQEFQLKNQIIIIDYLQLIKVEQEDIENRSQEIGNITRDLKLLAQKINSTLIILSQLNRNIENRSNKRPLLSDLRESGCIDDYHLPQIKKQSPLHYIDTIHTFKSFFLLNRTNKLNLHRTHKQHIFIITNKKVKVISLTHNHKILQYNQWKKKDHLKKQQFHSIKYNHSLNRLFNIELCLVHQITYLKKNHVYDLHLEIYHNFLINKCLIHNSIEQDADLILMLYKDHENTNNELIDIIIAKNRHGPIGHFQLIFQAAICKFNHLTKELTIN